MYWAVPLTYTRVSGYSQVILLHETYRGLSTAMSQGRVLGFEIVEDGIRFTPEPIAAANEDALERVRLKHRACFAI